MKITVTRMQRYKSHGSMTPGYAWKWIYSTDAGIAGYDSLTDLKRYLKRRFGNDIEIVEAWRKK